MNLPQNINSFFDFLFPRLCPVCERQLTISERYVCNNCMTNLPRTNLHLHDFNSMEQLFAGKTPIHRASGYFYYEKENAYAEILHVLKYHNNPKLGEWLASRFASELRNSGFFDDIDVVIPIPLHRSKLARRGYNQSEYIARGMAKVLNCNVQKAIIARRAHDTQTSKGLYERWLNTQNLYAAVNPESLEDKHVLIVDDVVTTGATLLAAAKSIADVKGIKITLATLAVARLG